MSKGPENTFIASVHRHLPVDLYRMKNHNQYNGGIADVWYSGKKADLWVEYKFITVPKRDETLIDLTGGRAPILSPLQQEWLEDRFVEGRSVGVLVGCKAGGVWLPDIDWKLPLTAAEFRASLMTRAALAQMIAARTYG